MADHNSNTTVKLFFHVSAQIIMKNISIFKKLGLVACNYVKVLDNDCQITADLV